MKLAMKLPIRCPTCNDVMMTEYKGEYVIIKSCSKHLDHHIIISANDRYDEVLKIIIHLEENYWVTWHVLSQELRVAQGSIATTGKLLGTPLPYFEPDLTDYARLIEKIKTYLVFS